MNLTNPIFTDEDKAREHFEATRWPNGAYCPFCGQFETVKRLGGKSMGPGWYHCSDCRRKFTALVGTVMERSHIPLTKWLMAMHLMCASKKGMSAHQLHRSLSVTYKSAWFLAHRIREAMRELNPVEPMGGNGNAVEIDETYVGGKAKNKHAHKRDGIGGGAGKEIVFALVERKGKVRSHHIADVTAKTVRPILEAQIHADATLYSDDGGSRVSREFPGHASVNHSIGEYVRGPVHTNTIEGYFSILKRGITGTYHHVSQKHLKRYLGEFDFRYNERAALGVDDTMRTERAVRGAVGKRVMYQGTNGARA
jgi:transposase-like protein